MDSLPVYFEHWLVGTIDIDQTYNVDARGAELGVEHRVSAARAVSEVTIGTVSGIF